MLLRLHIIDHQLFTIFRLSSLDPTRPKNAFVLPDVLSESECHQLINALDNIVVFRSSATLQVSEVSSVRLRHLDF